MPQKNIIIYFLVILIFAVNYGNAIDVEVGDGDYPFDPSYVNAYYDEPITFTRIGTKTFILTESDTPHCTKSERPDAFYAVLTAEQPKATFIPKNTGRTKFYIYTNKGCGFRNILTVRASKDPQGPKANQPNQPSSNNNDNNSNDSNNSNNSAGDKAIIINNCSVIVFAIIGVVMAHFVL